MKRTHGTPSRLIADHAGAYDIHSARPTVTAATREHERTSSPNNGWALSATRAKTRILRTLMQQGDCPSWRAVY